MSDQTEIKKSDQTEAKESDQTAAKESVKKGTKTLTQDALAEEITEYVLQKGYSADYFDKNEETFFLELIQHLQEKGYSLISILKALKEYDEEEEDPSETKKRKMPKKITKITEKLNDYKWSFMIFRDTTKVIPGTVLYVIESIAPSAQKPYVMYKPAARIVTQLHDNGVNGGTVFLTYEHKFVNTDNFSNNFRVVSEEVTIYYPLTFAHARYICKLLNIQSKTMYTEKVKELKEAQKNQKMLLKQNLNQKTK